MSVAFTLWRMLLEQEPPTAIRFSDLILESHGFIKLPRRKQPAVNVTFLHFVASSWKTEEGFFCFAEFFKPEMAGGSEDPMNMVRRGGSFWKRDSLYRLVDRGHHGFHFVFEHASSMFGE